MCIFCTVEARAEKTSSLGHVSSTNRASREYNGSRNIVVCSALFEWTHRWAELRCRIYTTIDSNQTIHRQQKANTRPAPSLCCPAPPAGFPRRLAHAQKWGLASNSCSHTCICNTSCPGWNKEANAFVESTGKGNLWTKTLELKRHHYSIIVETGSNCWGFHSGTFSWELKNVSVDSLEMGSVLALFPSVALFLG